MSVVLSLLGALLALAIATIGGGAVLYRARLGHGPIDLLVRALLGLALLASFHVHLAVGLTVAFLVAAATWRGHGLEDAVLEDARKPSAVAYGALTALALVALIRPPVPIFASDDALLALARDVSLRLHLPVADRSMTLPVITSALALGSADTTALTVGGTIALLVALALFVLLVAREAESSWDEALPIVVLFAAPFAWVHLRSVSVELAAGLFAASFALALARAEKGDRLGAPAAYASGLALAMVDTGVLLAVAVVLALVLVRAPRAAQRPAIGAVLLLGLAAMAERWGAPRLPLTDFAPRETGHVAIEALRHASDIQTWGLVPAIALAALVASLRPGATVAQRVPALAIVLALAMMLAALVLAPIELRERALEGALFDRLGLQLLPLAALLIARSLRK